MTPTDKDTSVRSAAFGRLSLRPRVCVVDSKPRNRTFLIDVLEDIGFITVECADTSEMRTLLKVQTFSLVVLGASADDIEIDKILQTLATIQFEGKVLPIAVPGSILAFAIQERARDLGIDTLPPLPALFTADMLHRSIATLIPAEAPPSPVVDVAEALSAGWLELWYQPKIDICTLVPRGAEALIRMRHPAWGVVLPTGFLPDDNDAAFRSLSDFVIGQALDDWHYFIEHNGPVNLSINLPVSSLFDESAFTALCRKIPTHPAFAGLVVELKYGEALANLDRVIDIAERFRSHNIAVSIEDIGADWPALAALTAVPFIEFKVDRQFITGFGNDRLKQTVCRGIVDLANEHGVRTVAEGIESRADFVTARQLGFDVAQGFLFSKAMTARQFAHTALTRPVTLPE
ncbi:response regulator receiver modulated diguanylate phosphodiesterase [Nitrobacter hamburgensis X14]|uniref:Response regulator receiver modulated diguanylate phosphodiesterase n=1 Tax=Nitrobacter hamburgensis (strain DSM 10229 / NCIMB 13809 / X14) TaxID=323097 RepID=Q1QHA9_NITHX|nr:response regulator receiver modulated diguanylate phosphodiesterase [Nitrobacter hamburgensis X14]